MPFTRALKSTSVLALALMAGCSAESAPPAAGTTVPAPSPPQARIIVRARTEGPLPENRRIDLDAESAAANPDGLSQEWVVAVDGRLANVVAWISSGHERREHVSPKAPAVRLHAKGTRFIPHVVSLGTGTPLEMTTEDKGCHFHVSSKLNGASLRRFGVPMLRPDEMAPPRTIEFSEPELGIRVACDVHGWTRAWVNVFDHPFHGVTNTDGEVTLNVPPGSYEVSVWHEWGKFGTQEPIAVTVAEGESREVTFVFRSK